MVMSCVSPRRSVTTVAAARVVAASYQTISSSPPSVYRRSSSVNEPAGSDVELNVLPLKTSKSPM